MENVSFAVNNQNKKEHIKVKKRQFSSVNEEPSPNQCCYGTLKILEKPFPSEDLISLTPDFPKVLHFKSTNAYTKIVAKPGSLPGAPKIFQSNTHKNKLSESSNGFLIHLLTQNSMKTDVNERFHHMFYTKNKKKKKKKKLKIRKEKTPKEKLRRTIINKEKWERKKLRMKEQKELMQQQIITSSEDDSSKNQMDALSKIDIYRVVQKKALIFHMHHPTRFSFHGEIKITLITGEIEVLGYTLSKDSADAYSPDFCAPLTIETKPLKENQPVDDIQSKLKDFLPEEDCKAVLTKLRADDSIILVEQILSTFGIVINKYFDRPLFPKDLEDVSSQTETLKSLQSIFTFKLPKKGKHFRKSPEWDKIPLGQCTALCGGKGVGKSTLLKYYVNKLVTLGEKVLCLDFDPGQPEFTFPGCVSAVIIDQPLLGPNFTHVIEPVVMMSFGDVDVTHNPSKYIECVNHIIESCKKNEELLRMKWFINTMGFCKGLGVNLIITILKLLKPNTVIQIKSSDCKNNYPMYLTSVTLNSRSGFRSMPLDNVNLSYDLKVIYSCAEYKKKPLQGGLKQRQLRDIMAISYFSKMVSPPFYNFNAVQPFLIPFSKLYLGIDFLIDPNDVLKAFNGNVVALSHFQSDDEDILSVESEEDAYFKVVVKPSVAPSLGVGLVRGIDCQEKKFYIMTHLPIETLEKVNCLNLARVSPPHSMFLKQETVEGQTVYTTLGTIDVVQRVKRIFRVPGTHQNLEN